MNKFVLQDNIELSEKSQAVSEIINQVLVSADPESAILKYLKISDQKIEIDGFPYDITLIKNIYVIGAGKGAYLMAKFLEKELGNKLSGGVVIYKNIPAGEEYVSPKIKFCQGGHPVPDEKSVAATQELLDFTENLTKDDLVLCVITGGGSALMTCPAEGISIQNLQDMTGVLFACGAEIGEMNILRKHLDIVKGGGLARKVFPAKLVTFILSDVIGSPLDVIASGPSVPDTSTFFDAREVIDKYEIAEKLPESIIKRIDAGIRGEIQDTVKPDDECVKDVRNIIITDNYQAGLAAVEKARELGFNSMLLTSFLRGEASQAGIFLGSLLHQIAATGIPLERPACIIAGGETTVNIIGSGKGGRNQELALGAVRELAGLEKVYLITLATDGEDGPTDAAGAIVSGETLQMGLNSGFNPDDYLKNNDAYHYFEKLNRLLIIGSTGTNINDMTFLFAL